MLRPAVLLLGLLCAAEPALVAGVVRSGPPTRLGRCAFTTVERVETRLEDQDGSPIANSGSAVKLANGVYGVSYDAVPAVDHSRAGDRVMTCLTYLPTDCPAGDRRGKWYTTSNLRTEEAWMLPDSEHQCGGG